MSFSKFTLDLENSLKKFLTHESWFATMPYYFSSLELVVMLCKLKKSISQYIS